MPKAKKRIGDFVVGQKLVYLPDYTVECYLTADPDEYTVTKVGRRWVTVKCEDYMEDYVTQFNRFSMRERGRGYYASPGEFFLSRKDMQKKLALRRAHASFRSMVVHSQDYSLLLDASLRDVDPKAFEDAAKALGLFNAYWKELQRHIGRELDERVGVE